MKDSLIKNRSSSSKDEEANMKRRRNTIIIDSESDEDCKEVERSHVDCSPNEVEDKNSGKKTPKEIALDKAIMTGERLAKKINDIELIFSNGHVEDKKWPKRVAVKSGIILKILLIVPKGQNNH